MPGRVGSVALRARPAGVCPGDRVAVVAPSGPVEQPRLEAGCALLRDLGLDVVVGKHAVDRTGFLAGTDADRAEDLQWAWCDPEVRAVLCARGGYGAARMLEHLDWAALAAAVSANGPTLLHGSSDVTALHVSFGQRLSVTTSFGPMVASVLGAREPDPASLAGFTGRLFADTEDLGGPTMLVGTHALAEGTAVGVLTGGNLSLLVSLLATPYAPEPARGRIAFLEDVGEEPYRVDRMLTQLRQAGWFEGVAGVVLGSWSGCGDRGQLAEVLAERLLPLDVPILAGVPVGHGMPQLTVEMGAEVRLDANAGTVTEAREG